VVRGWARHFTEAPALRQEDCEDGTAVVSNFYTILSCVFTWQHTDWKTAVADQKTRNVMSSYLSAESLSLNAEETQPVDGVQPIREVTASSDGESRQPSLSTQGSAATSRSSTQCWLHQAGMVLCSSVWPGDETERMLCGDRACNLASLKVCHLLGCRNWEYTSLALARLTSSHFWQIQSNLAPAKCSARIPDWADFSKAAAHINYLQLEVMKLR